MAMHRNNFQQKSSVFTSSGIFFKSYYNSFIRTKGLLQGDLFLFFIYHNQCMENEQFYLDKFKTEADYLLFDVPRECRTYAICLEAVKRDWQNFSLVPYDLRTAEICIEALKHEGEKQEALPYIPKTIRDPQVWLLAVKNGFDIRKVPRELLTEEMCVYTIEYKWKDWLDEWQCKGKWLDHDWFDDEWDPHSLPKGLCDDVPEHFRTRAFWLAVIKANAIFIRYTPEHFKTDDFYWEAARINGAILEYVPAEFETSEFLLEAVKSSSKALPLVPKERWTKGLYSMAVKCHGTALEFVPYSYQRELEALCFGSIMSIDTQIFHFLTGQAGILNNLIYWSVAFHHVLSDG